MTLSVCDPTPNFLKHLGKYQKQDENHFKMGSDLNQEMLSRPRCNCVVVSADRCLSRTAINETQRAKMRRWNPVDTILYEYFNRTLWRKPGFGRNLDRFHKMKQDFYGVCSFKTKAVEGYFRMTTKNSSAACRSILEPEMKEIHRRQNKGQKWKSIGLKIGLFWTK